MIRPTGLVVTLLIWLVVAFVVSTHGFTNASAPVIALTIWGSSHVARLLGWWIFSAVRRRVDALPLAALIAIHLCRFVGVYFLILGNAGCLSKDFAFPAGIGDIVVAIGAVLLLLSNALRQRRAVVLGWNVIGLIDIVFVVFSALRCGLRDWSSIALLRQLPLSLLPTFVVPLIMVSHVLIFIRIASGRKMGSEGFEPPTLSV